jgi:diacylglycerol kinase
MNGNEKTTPPINTSFEYAFKGIWILFKEQRNAKIHLLATIIVIIVGAALGINIYDWALLAFAIGMVWCAEAFNTCIEYIVDFISPRHDSKAGKIKDIAAGGVFIAALSAVAVGLIIFIPELINLLNNY